jgi:hypothetical protein
LDGSPSGFGDSEGANDQPSRLSMAEHMAFTL